MTQQTESAQQFAYAIFYEAFRAGAVRKYQLMFSAEEQLSSGEAFQAMAEQVGRTAVSNGQANSIEDVTITNVSLLNPVVIAPIEDSDDITEIHDEIMAEYVLKIESALMDAYLGITENKPIDTDLLEEAHALCKSRHQERIESSIKA